MNNTIFNFYKLQTCSSYILHLRYPCYLNIRGKLRITLIYGKVEIFGYTLSDVSKCKTLDLYSPQRCMSFSVVLKLPDSTCEIDNIKKVLKDKYTISDENLKKLLDKFNARDTLLLVENLMSNFLAVLDYYCDFDFFYSKSIATNSLVEAKDLQCLCNFRTYEINDRRQFTKGTGWDDIEVKNCTVICGGKGVGKSTLFKYLINRTISDSSSVLCIDLDPGQNELIAPGCLAAALIYNPLMGPNFTHVINPEQYVFPNLVMDIKIGFQSVIDISQDVNMVYFGEIDVALNPSAYMQSVEYIIKCCRENSKLSGIPWLINTMGFNKGIGVHIMTDIIKATNPDAVIQIFSSHNSLNYPFELTAERIKSSSDFFLRNKHSHFNYEYYKLKSCAKFKGIGFQRGFKPAELREIMLLSYLGQMVSFPYHNFNAVEPKWISFKNIYLAVKSEISPIDILKAFNGNLVGLCCLQEEMCEKVLTAEEPEYFKIAIKPSVIPCYGLGIVRCIDCKEKKIYLLTHLSVNTLEKVNCLTIGSITPPTSIFLRQFDVEGPAVYTTINKSENVKGVKRSFKYFPRFDDNYT